MCDGLCIAQKQMCQISDRGLLRIDHEGIYFIEILCICYNSFIYLLKVIIILPPRNYFTPLFSFISCLNYSKIIKRTPDILYALCSNMRIYLSCLAALMSQQLLYIPQIRTRFKQMGGITMP